MTIRARGLGGCGPSSHTHVLAFNYYLKIKMAVNIYLFISIDGGFLCRKKFLMSPRL